MAEFGLKGRLWVHTAHRKHRLEIRPQWMRRMGLKSEDTNPGKPRPSLALNQRACNEAPHPPSPSSPTYADALIRRVTPIRRNADPASNFKRISKKSCKRNLGMNFLGMQLTAMKAEVTILNRKRTCPINPVLPLSTNDGISAAKHVRFTCLIEYATSDSENIDYVLLM